MRFLRIGDRLLIRACAHSGERSCCFARYLQWDLARTKFYFFYNHVMLNGIWNSWNYGIWRELCHAKEDRKNCKVCRTIPYKNLSLHFLVNTMDDLPRVFFKSVFNYLDTYRFSEYELQQFPKQLPVLFSFIQERQKHGHYADLILYLSPRSSRIHAELLCCTRDDWKQLPSKHVDVGSQLDECLWQVAEAKRSGFFLVVKVASSVAHGVGSFTFDEQHELMSFFFLVVNVLLMADRYIPTWLSLTSFDSRCPRFQKLLQLCTCSRQIDVGMRTDTPEGVDFDFSWVFDNLLRKDICLSHIDFIGRSNNLWSSFVMQEWEKDADSVKTKCIWGHRDEKFPDDFVNGFEELKDAPPLFERHARKFAKMGINIPLHEGNHYVKEHPTERGRKLYLWLKNTTEFINIRGPEEYRSTEVMLCF
ncbi:hypothetical protein L596_027286 [Steinernema carpocapsae]|uniref:Uncharacterized protein n=1 Tax=Steinernema carpocapsae TaxID=34508 RepID=A0A4U5M3V4_STECR|nr:hypothetical protein L596_027286 [Steinernema carpocapsae]